MLRGIRIGALPSTALSVMNSFGSVGSLALVRVVASLLQAAFLILLARNVSLTEFGYYSASVSIGSIATGVFGLGLATRSLRLAAEGLHHLILSHLAIGFLSATSIAIVVLVYASWNTSAVQWWAVAGALFVSSEYIVGIVQALLFGDLRNRRAESLIIGRRIVPFATTVAALLVSSSSVFPAATVGFAATIVLSVALLGRQVWHGWNLQQVLRSSWQYWLANIGSMLQQLDVPIIASSLGAAAAGAFAGAFRLASPVHIVTSSMVSLFVPKLSHEKNPLRRLTTGRRLMKFGLAYSSMVAIFAPFSIWVGPFLLGEEFSRFAFVFPILTLNSAVSVLNQLQAARLYAEGRASTVASSTISSTLLGLLVVAIGAWKGNLYIIAFGTFSIQAVLLIVLAIATWQISTQVKSSEGWVND